MATCAMPLESDASNVTGTEPHTPLPPHNAPARLETEGVAVSERVTFTEYMSACAKCSVEPARQSVSGATGSHSSPKNRPDVLKPLNVTGTWLFGSEQGWGSVLQTLSCAPPASKSPASQSLLSPVTRLR